MSHLAAPEQLSPQEVISNLKRAVEDIKSYYKELGNDDQIPQSAKKLFLILDDLREEDLSSSEIEVLHEYIPRIQELSENAKKFRHSLLPLYHQEGHRVNLKLTLSKGKQIADSRQECIDFLLSVIKYKNKESD